MFMFVCVVFQVRAKGYTTCRFLERSGMVCSEPDPPRLRYDSRVAPRCVTPERHRHNSVFRVTARRLKCPKRMWNPRPQVVSPSSPALPSEPQVNTKEKVETPVVEESSWLPLSAFSVPPHEVKDLLEIAEAEMPEEAYAPLPEGEEELYVEEDEEKEVEAAELIEEAEEELQDMRKILEEDEDVHPFDVAERFVRRQRERYRQEKQMMKKQMEEEERRRDESLQAMKRRHWDRLAENKKRMKAQWAEEQRRDLERKEEEMNEFVKNQELYPVLVATRDNNIRPV